MTGVAVTLDGKEAMLATGAPSRAPRHRGHGGTTGGQDGGGRAPPDPWRGHP